MTEQTEFPSEPAPNPLGHSSVEVTLQPLSDANTTTPPPQRDPNRRRRRRISPRWISILLFLAACGTTFWAGMQQFVVYQLVKDKNTERIFQVLKLNSSRDRYDPVVQLGKMAINGVIYSAAIMLTLAAHEMGHYLQARRYGVPASPPFFLPMPIGPVGTMGAVILQAPGVATRKSLFDIAISGPLAGLAIAIPLNLWGVQHSTVSEVRANSMGWTNPKIVEWMVAWIHHPLGPNEDIELNPILFAGWVGLFITAINLVPIGQLDGGHLLYCLLGKRAWTIAKILFIAAVSFVAYQLAIVRNDQYVSWVLMLSLVGLMGTRHPPTANDNEPLGATRIILGWLTLAFIYVGFVSTPLYLASANDNHPAERGPLILTPEQTGYEEYQLVDVTSFIGRNASTQHEPVKANSESLPSPRKAESAQ